MFALSESSAKRTRTPRSRCRQPQSNPSQIRHARANGEPTQIQCELNELASELQRESALTT